jgi:NAD(P)-dependent dehydrogenase (short-subunit alcohol dehydrogenase family)
MRLEGKTALVTGASSGIGHAIGRRLGNEGAHVGLVANSQLEKAEELADKIVADGGNAFAVKTNLTDVGGIESLVDVALDKLGHIDILVNCAGVFYIRLLGELTEEEWDTTLDVNVKGPFFLTQKVVAHMVERGSGNVIFVGSIFGPRGVPGAASYGASKAALHGLTECLAIELAPTIRVNAVAPGNIDTPMNQELYDKFGGREAFRVQYPMGRIGLEEDVASAVTYLVSDEAEWITGVIMPVDGGYMAK